MQMRPIPPPIYIGATINSWKGVFEVERWKGEMVERFPRNRHHQTIKLCHPGQAGVLDGSATIRWGGIA